MKYFSGHEASQISNLSIQLRKKCLQNLHSIKKWMMIDKNVFEIMTLTNNLVLICSNFKFYSLCMIREICAF